MTKKWILVAAAGVLIALLAAGVVGATAAFAQETPPTGDVGPMRGFVRGRGGFGVGMLGRGPFGGDRWAMFDTIAEALGLTPEELFSELHAGKSLDEVAEAHGVDMQAVKDVLTTARAESMRGSISAAVEDGDMSQAEADWLLEGLDRGYLPRVRGFGRGRGACPAGD